MRLSTRVTRQATRARPCATAIPPNPPADDDDVRQGGEVERCRAHAQVGARHPVERERAAAPRQQHADQQDPVQAAVGNRRRRAERRQEQQCDRRRPNREAGHEENRGQHRRPQRQGRERGRRSRQMGDHHAERHRRGRLGRRRAHGDVRNHNDHRDQQSQANQEKRGAAPREACVEDRDGTHAGHGAVCGAGAEPSIERKRAGTENGQAREEHDPKRIEACLLADVMQQEHLQDHRCRGRPGQQPEPPGGSGRAPGSRHRSRWRRRSVSRPPTIRRRIRPSGRHRTSASTPAGPERPGRARVESRARASARACARAERRRRAPHRGGDARPRNAVDRSAPSRAPDAESAFGS